MNILIVCVCYNNPNDMLKYLDSIVVAIDASKNEMLNLSFTVVNNGNNFTSDILEHLNSYKNKLTLNVIENVGNVGYFPGMHIGWKKHASSFFEYIIVSNVDLKIEPDFFEKLLDSYDDKRKVIGPSIISETENKNRNPKILTRPLKKTMRKYVFLYTIPYLHHFYKTYIYPKKAKREGADFHLKSIYAPHGSFIIFQNLSDKIEAFLSYPVFLFGEEIHVGEIARNNNVDVIYNNNLVIIDSDHATTSLQKESFLRENNLKAMKYLLSTFW